MAAVVFPTYALARLAVRPGWALFAAAGAGISPALAYAPVLVKEPTAYPIGDACAVPHRAMASPSPMDAARCSRSAAAYSASGRRTSSRILFPVLGLCILAVIWRREPGDTRSAPPGRAPTGSDCVTLAVGVVIVAGAYASSKSNAWYISTTFFQDRMINYGLWAAGALTIGLGLVPLIAGLASLVRPKGEAPTARCRGARIGDRSPRSSASASTRPSRPPTCRRSTRRSFSSGT